VTCDPFQPIRLQPGQVNEAVVTFTVTPFRRVLTRAVQLDAVGHVDAKVVRTRLPLVIVAGSIVFVAVATFASVFTAR